MTRSMWGTGGRPNGLAAAIPLAGIPATRTHPPVGWITLEAEGLAELTVLVEIGARKPWATAGSGSWTAVDKPGDKALTRSAGYNATTIPVDLVIDGDGRAVNDIVDTIDALAGRGPKRIPGASPKLIVDARGLVPYDASVFPSVRWVIPQDGLAWSDNDDDNATNSDGQVTLATCTVTLMECNEGDRLPDRQLAARMRSERAKTSKSKRYTVQNGWDLIQVAQHKLGDGSRWVEIKDVHGHTIRDPFAVKDGAVVLLP